MPAAYRDHKSIDSYEEEKASWALTDPSYTSDEYWDDLLEEDIDA